MDDTFPEFFTDRKLCARWRCSHMKLWRLRSQGKLRKPVKIGDSVRALNLTPAEAVKQLEEAGGHGTS
jgi:hypothetical protein